MRKSKKTIERLKRLFIKEKIKDNEDRIDIKDSRKREIISKIIVYVFIVFFAIMVLIPFYWMILTSLKTLDKVEEIPPALWLSFKDMMFVNYLNALDAAPYLRYMLNTVIVAAVSTTGTIFTTIFASFAFARLNFRGRDIIFMILISTMMIPGEMFVITNYITVSRLGWYSPFNQTFGQAILALTLPFMTSIFYIFFLRQAFKQIPDELYLASKVDGTSDFKYLWRIMVPIAKPTIITITILNAMGTWSAYIWPNLVTKEVEYRLVTNGLRNAYLDLTGRIAYNEQMAAAMIVTFPLLVVFLLLKKYIMRGVSRSGIKG
ncbi:MAG: carbohydrate ABC transporter permease [Candidatus Izimaplasma sp.]|nr:carbohydrate ABC transporter permease [Candidatus Izimaplasma bacterium]